MDRLADFTPQEQDQLNSDGAIEKRSRRFTGFRVCTSCGLMVGAGYRGFVFTECPVCSGDLKEVPQ
jgi:hypothetical protein